MFLALREMRHSAPRFVLIAIVIFLVSYLVYFLTGLANGLASSYSETVEKWQANSIVLKKSANYSAAASGISQGVKTEILDAAPDARLIEITPVVINMPASEGKDPRQSAFVFGADMDSNLAPEIVAGELPQKDNEVVADVKLQREGLKIGDEIKLPAPQSPESDEKSWQITGFVVAKFQAAPSFFVVADAFSQHLRPVRNPHISVEKKIVANAVVLFSEPSQQLRNIAEANELEIVAPDTFIKNMPGFNAQRLTFGLMIGSLIGILTLVLAIFIYVLTVQKRQIFGIMKAQGVPTSYIAAAGAAQTVMLTVAGICLGLLATLATAAAMGSAVPFKADPLLYAGISGAFVLAALLGGLVPTRMISKIDPGRGD